MTAILTGMGYNLRVFISILLMTEKDDISSYLYWTCLFHLVRIFYSFHLSICRLGCLCFWQVFCLFCSAFGGFFVDFCCCCSLDILDIDLQSAINSKSSLPFCWLSLQLIISFAAQRLLNFMPSHINCWYFSLKLPFWEPPWLCLYLEVFPPYFPYQFLGSRYYIKIFDPL